MSAPRRDDRQPRLVPDPGLGGALLAALALAMVLAAGPAAAADPVTGPQGHPTIGPETELAPEPVDWVHWILAAAVAAPLSALSLAWIGRPRRLPESAAAEVAEAPAEEAADGVFDKAVWMKHAGADVRLPAHPRRSMSVGVGMGAAILFGAAALVLLAPQLFPATDEHLFLAEKMLFATLVAAPGGFFGWAVAGRVEASRG
jgi:hypothetical protein